MRLFDDSWQLCCEFSKILVFLSTEESWQVFKIDLLSFKEIHDFSFIFFYRKLHYKTGLSGLKYVAIYQEGMIK